MNVRLLIILTFLGISMCVQAQYASKEQYLVDSLPFNELTPGDQNLIDSVLNIYHGQNVDNPYLLLNEIVDKTWDNRVWPKYNLWILKGLEKEQTQSPLDSTQKTLYAGSLINHGYYLRVIGEIESALSYYEKSQKVYNELNNKEGLAFCQNNIGVIYENLGDLPKAIECYHKALKLQEEIDEKVGQANSLANIGDLHYKMGDTDKSLQFFEEALKMQRAIKERRSEAMTLIKMSQIYFEKNDEDKMKELLNRSLKINRQIDDVYGMASSLSEIGKVLYRKKNYRASIDTLEKAIKLYNNIFEKQGAAIAYKMVASSYYAIGMLEEAKINVEKCIKMGEELGFVSLISSGSMLLSQIYEKEGDTDNALKYFKKHISLKDSVTNEENKKLTIRMQLQHDFEKQKAIDDKERESQIALAKAEEHRQRIVSIAFAVIGLLTVIFAIIVFNRLRVTRKQKDIIAETNEELSQTNEEILAQRDEIEQQKILVDEKNREITDSINYAKRIQEAILPPDDLFKKSLPESFVIYKPKAVVAGDFYWLEAIDDTIFFAAADCTGHGVPGAMVSVVCHGALNRSVREYGLRKPSEILDKTRELVVETFRKSQEQVMDGMDIALCALNRNTGMLQYAGANNNLYVIHENTMDVIKADRQAIGYVKEPKKFINHEVNITKGSFLYLSTDGYVDQFGGDKGKKLGYKNFRERLLQVSTQPLKNQKELLTSYFDEWRGVEDQLDDVCIVGVKLT